DVEQLVGADRRRRRLSRLGRSRGQLAPQLEHDDEGDVAAGAADLHGVRAAVLAQQLEVAVDQRLAADRAVVVARTDVDEAEDVHACSTSQNRQRSATAQSTPRVSQMSSLPRTRSTIAAVNSSVSACPPRSAVRTPSRTASNTDS